jgi:hypothetical protein
MPSGHVKVSFFGGLDLGRINDPLRKSDNVLLVASLEDPLNEPSPRQFSIGQKPRTTTTSPPCLRPAFRSRRRSAHLQKCTGKTQGFPSGRDGILQQQRRFAIPAASRSETASGSSGRRVRYTRAQAAEWIAAGQPKVTLFGACLPKARCVFERLFRKPNSVKRDRFR